MKPSHINGLLLAALLLFAIGYLVLNSGSETGIDEALPPASIPTASQVDMHSTDVSITVLQERVAESPEDTTLLIHLAQLLHDEQRYEEAATHYNRLLALNPQHIQGWLDLANVYAALKDWDNALRASESLLAFAPDHPSAMYNMGAIHANLSNTEQAIQWWTQVQNQEDDPDLAMQAGLSLQQISP